MSKIRSIAIILGAILVMLPSAARAQVTPTEMKLLTQNTGWALMRGRLYKTNDFGQDWLDITPPLNPPGAAIADVFFLDTSNGWALLRTSRSTMENVLFGDWGFELAHTDNGGASWTVNPVQLSGLAKYRADLGGGGDVDFVDPAHGWIDLSLESSAAVARGVLFSTDDGGETWQRVRNAPMIAAAVQFVTRTDGWLAGGGGGQYLYSTHDGGQTWARTTLRAPAQTGSATYLSYRLPIFKSPRQALLPITFWAPESQTPTIVLFRSNDGGRTWGAGMILKNRPEGAHYGFGSDLPASLVDHALITAEARSHGRIALRVNTPIGESQVVGSAAVGTGSVVSGIEFWNAGRGWVLVGSLYATADGGATWADITPKKTASTTRHISQRSQDSPEALPVSGAVQLTESTTNAGGDYDSYVSGINGFGQVTGGGLIGGKFVDFVWDWSQGTFTYTYSPNRECGSGSSSYQGSLGGINNNELFSLYCRDTSTGTNWSTLYDFLRVATVAQAPTSGGINDSGDITDGSGGIFVPTQQP